MKRSADKNECDTVLGFKKHDDAPPPPRADIFAELLAFINHVKMYSKVK